MLIYEYRAGIPIMFSFMLLYTRKDRYNPLFLKSYAIFWNKYQPALYWWEMMYTARKLIMAMIIIFLREYYLFQATIFCVTWIVFMVKNYDDDSDSELACSVHHFPPCRRVDMCSRLGILIRIRMNTRRLTGSKVHFISVLSFRYVFFSNIVLQYNASWPLTLLQFLLTFFLRVSGDVEYRKTYVTLNLTITAAMILYGMSGFVQELQQTLKANGILEQSEHFQSLGTHLKEGEV